MPILIQAFSEFIQLMDDDVVSLIGLTLLVNSSRGRVPPNVTINQLCLPLYLMTRCQINFHHSPTSLATIPDYLQLVRSHIGQMLNCESVNQNIMITLHHLLRINGYYLISIC